MTVKAIGCKAGYSNSAVASFSYTINVITPVAIEAFPDTSVYPTVTWTPNVKFSIVGADTIGLYSDTSGTAINTPAAASAGSNTFLANTESSAGVTKSVYAKNSSANEYKSMGSYTTKLPPSYTTPTPNGAVYAIIKDSITTGCTTVPYCIIVGGTFTAISGKTVNYIARIRADGSIEALGTGMDALVYTLGIDSTGNIYAGGTFLTAGGASANRIAKWNGTAWSALGTGLGGSVYSIAIYSSNNVYVGGNFTTAGGASAYYTAKSDGTSWSAQGTGMDDYVRAVAVDSGGNLYAGGNFTSAGGVAYTAHIAKWNGTAWSALGTGMSTAVHALAFDSGGNLYAGGGFNVAGGTTANFIAKWNGSVWSALGPGFASPGTVKLGSRQTTSPSGTVQPGARLDPARIIGPGEWSLTPKETFSSVASSLPPADFSGHSSRYGCQLSIRGSRKTHSR